MTGASSRADFINLPKKLEFLSKPISRGSLRGLKRCPGCRWLNGVRSSVCDPIRLESLDSSKILYSIRTKEQNANPRNFVLSALTDGNGVITYICYSCDNARSAVPTLCKHINACNARNANALSQAETFEISRDVLWNLNGLDEEHKQRLWGIYQQEENNIPAVQRISNALFVVRCDVSKVFPAGRLHVTALRNGNSTKKGIYSCSCKKLKIIVEPDNSVVMQEEMCDHILLVLAAVLSNRKGKTAYCNFTSALKSYWMPTSIETPIVDSTQEDALFGLSIDIGGNFDMERSHNEHVDDIFICNNDFMSDGTIPDFEDIILDNALSTNITTHTNNILHPGDPNLGLSFAITAEDVEDIKLFDEPSINEIKTVPTHLNNSTNMTTAHLELSDCKIELMDQFEPTDQIDLSSTDDITIQGDATWLGNSISILEAPVLSTSTASAINCNTVSPVIKAPTTPTDHASYYNNNSLLKANQVVEALPIELPTIAMVKKCPIKAKELVHEVNTRKFPPLPAKRSLIVNKPTTTMQPHHENIDEKLQREQPSLAFSAWLDYVIEVINESVTIVEQRNVEHTFHVHEEIFAHFSKSFSSGIKLRIPNTTTVVKTGKYTGLYKYVWYFTTASTVRRIFTTENISIQTERIFEYNSDGVFVPYLHKPPLPAANSKLKRVYPKLSLYKAHIWFESGVNEHKSSFKLEWLPNAFPKSHHGILKLEFSIGVQGPQETQISIEKTIKQKTK
ncbi:uncharacterized protein [Eurosta solidaginis]|uniref:uncharacterized protein isoform X2 n=1 Tax=Eurosta solidaginis TaxID=178769 RepID=UPI0035312764